METAVQQTKSLKEVLAGHQGHSSDYERTKGLGSVREPFTWLSDSGPAMGNAALAGELQEFKREHQAVWFEAWELKEAGWRSVVGGRVVMLYVEVDARLSRVRAILQWTDPRQFDLP